MGIADSDKDLEELYGPLAPYSEHKQGDVITYISTDGTRQSGTIIWISARFESVPLEYLVAPDDGNFPVYVYPQDVIVQEEQP